MVKGIETDSKKYKHKKRDTKWLTKDLQVYKKTVQNYIDEQRPDDIDELDNPSTKTKKKTMTIDRIISIIFLGIFGTACLIAGIYLTITEIYVIGIPAALFGALFVMCFILYEKYR